MMFARFKIRLDDNELKNESYREHGNAQYILQKRDVRSCIDKYISTDGSLDAVAIEADWFPKTKAKVFLSHAHKDEELVKRFAGFLKNKYGISSFIDSAVWGYANDLLKEIDKKYCVKTPKDSGGYTYDYNKRNQSTTHVHMILQGALAKMINSCECLIFVNTPNSLKVSDINSETNTASPWIYNEILMASTFPLRSYESHRTDRLMHFDAKVSYKINLTEFVDVSIADFIDAGKNVTVSLPETILDNLYLKKGILV